LEHEFPDYTHPTMSFSFPLLLSILTGATVTAASGAAIRAGFHDTLLPGNDDGSTGPVALGFAVDFYARTGVNHVYVNNNGNVTFGGPLGSYTPFPILTTSTVMLAPFFADVDTRYNLPDVYYGTGTVEGRPAFGVDWIDVGYYNAHLDQSNSFQLVIIDRSDIAPGDFDFEFNYDRIEWETGDASGGLGGLGGSSARAGWSDGATASFEIDGSALNGGLLDGNQTTGLIHHSLNSDVEGRYVFHVRNGSVLASAVPDGGTTFGLTGIALAGLLALKPRKRSK
jgi:hypothetical protein